MLSDKELAAIVAVHQKAAPLFGDDSGGSYYDEECCRAHRQRGLLLDEVQRLRKENEDLHDQLEWWAHSEGPRGR